MSADDDLPDLPVANEDDELPEAGNSDDELPPGPYSDVDSEDEKKEILPPSKDTSLDRVPLESLPVLPLLPPEPLPEEEGTEGNWIKVQIKTFTRWCNSYLEDRKLTILDITSDFRDGTNLINLVELLSGKKLGKYTAHPTMEIHSQENLTIALHFIEKKEAIKLVNIDSVEIYRGNLKLTLGLIWSLILRYQILRAIDEGSKDRKHEGEDFFIEAEDGPQKSTKQLLLDWINKQLKPYRDRIDLPRITNFHSDWSDGRAISCLTDSLAPGVINVDELNGKPIVDTRNAMEICEKKFLFPHIMDAEDMVENPDERSMMTYLAYFKLYRAQQARGNKGTDPAHTYAVGPGVKAGLQGQRNEFVIYSKNAQGAPTLKGGDKFVIRAVSGSGEEYTVDIRDNKDGTYTCGYRPEVSGPITVDIKLQVPKLYKLIPTSIKGSVYQANVTAVPGYVAVRRGSGASLSPPSSTAPPPSLNSGGGQAYDEGLKKFQEAKLELQTVSQSEALLRGKTSQTDVEDDHFVEPLIEDDEWTTDEESEVEADDEGEDEKDDSHGEEELTPEQKSKLDAKVAEDMKNHEALLRKAEQEAKLKAEHREAEFKRILQESKARDKTAREGPLRLPDGQYVMPDGSQIIMPYGSLRWGLIKLAARYDTKTNKVLIHLMEARCLIPMQSHKYSNPYGKIYMLPVGKTASASDKSFALKEAFKELTEKKVDPTRVTKAKTKAHKKTLKPVFGDKLSFSCLRDHLAEQVVDIAIWHKGLLYHAFMGRIDLHPENLPVDKQENDIGVTNWYALQPRDLGGLTHSGSIEVSKDVIKYPDGCTKNADGTITIPIVGEEEKEGKIIPFDAKAPLPQNGLKRLKDGCVLLWDETILLPSGAITRSDGNLRMPDGTIQKPKWLLESVRLPKGGKQKEDFSFEIDSTAVHQPKTSNTGLKLGVLKISARFYSEKQLIQVKVLEARGITSLKRGPTDVYLTLRLLPVDKKLNRKERQLLEFKTTLANRMIDHVFNEEFVFKVQGKKKKKATLVKDLKQSTLQIKVWEYRKLSAARLIGHCKANLSSTVIDPFQWHSIVPVQKIRRAKSAETKTTTKPQAQQQSLTLPPSVPRKLSITLSPPNTTTETPRRSSISSESQTNASSSGSSTPARRSSITPTTTTTTTPLTPPVNQARRLSNT